MICSGVAGTAEAEGGCVKDTSRQRSRCFNRPPRSAPTIANFNRHTSSHQAARRVGGQEAPAPVLDSTRSLPLRRAWRSPGKRTTSDEEESGSQGKQSADERRERRKSPSSSEGMEAAHRVRQASDSTSTCRGLALGHSKDSASTCRGPPFWPLGGLHEQLQRAAPGRSVASGRAAVARSGVRSTERDRRTAAGREVERRAVRARSAQERAHAHPHVWSSRRSS